MRVQQSALVLSLALLQLALCAQSGEVQPKQSSTALLSTITSMVPGVVADVLPLVFMFGLGALLVPTLGLSSLLREARQRSLSTFRSLDTTGFVYSVQEVFDKFNQAIDNMDHKYN